MARKKKTVYDNNLIDALKKLPLPIVDERHNAIVVLDDDRARSNQGRFEHISRSFHRLTQKDIESIPKGIATNSKLKKDPVRKNTLNYYFPREGDRGHYIKISVKIDKKNTHILRIKTIFITTIIK